METKQKTIREKPIPEFKKKLVEEIANKIKNNRTFLIASCKNLPGPQFHEIKKKLRGTAEIKIAKKTAITRAVDKLEKGTIKKIKEHILSDYAIIFSDIEPFELSGILTENQSETKAKPGDLAPYDIKVEPGPTELIAGPAISELGSVGLKVKVTDGKLEIIKGATVAKEGEEISANAASVLAKLGVKPLQVGFLPLAAYDAKDDKVYENIRIDKPETLNAMKELIGKALNFAINVNYPCEKTIIYFIAKASAEEKTLSKLTEREEKTEQPKEETPKEETNNESAETKSDEENSEEITKEEEK